MPNIHLRVKYSLLLIHSQLLAFFHGILHDGHTWEWSFFDCVPDLGPVSSNPSWGWVVDAGHTNSSSGIQLGMPDCTKQHWLWYVRCEKLRVFLKWHLAAELGRVERLFLVASLLPLLLLSKMLSPSPSFISLCLSFKVLVTAESTGPTFQGFLS